MLEDSLRLGTPNTEPQHTDSQQHTPTGYAPYIRKRRTSEESHPPQVPNKIQITPKILPVWTPPQPTLSPQEQSQPIHLLPTTIPPLPTPPAALPTNHLENNPIQTIQPLMSITFTPHTILQIKTRLHQQQSPRTPHLHTPRHHFTSQHPLPTTPFVPFLNTLTQLLQTLHHTVKTLHT